jgi:hypothetical protein
VVPGKDGVSDLAISTDTELMLQFLAGVPVSVPAEGDRELLERMPELFPLAA